MRQAGFTCADFSLNGYLLNTDLYRSKVNRFFDRTEQELEHFFAPHKLGAEAAGITVNQMHMPYPSYVPNGSRELNEYLWNIVAPKSMRVCAFFGCKYTVVRRTNDQKDHENCFFEDGCAMKAFLLAAGYGTRLRPITDSVPKCLVPIHGQPLLGWWFQLLHKHRVTDVLVNTHYLADPVRAYMKEYNLRNTGLTAYEAYETELLGSGGTICANRDFVKAEDTFLICYADNLTDVNLTAFQNFHRDHKSLLSMALFHTNVPKQCGIAELDSVGRIIAFEEKPAAPRSSLANAGIYIVDQRIFDYLDSDKSLLDFGKDVLPRLIGEMYGWYADGYLIDIGTLENYRKASEEWPYDYHEDAAAH